MAANDPCPEVKSGWYYGANATSAGTAQILASGGRTGAFRCFPKALFSLQLFEHCGPKRGLGFAEYRIVWCVWVMPATATVTCGAHHPFVDIRQCTGPGFGLSIWMEYRGKHYTVVQGIGPQSWRWSVHLDEKTLKSGESKTRASAVVNAVWLIDKALAPKKKLFQPDD
jgi:hypothetical protein